LASATEEQSIDATGGAHDREVLKEASAWLFATVPPSPAP
jgi:hypothetical protein